MCADFSKIMQVINVPYKRLNRNVLPSKALNF